MAHRKATARLICRRGSIRNDYVSHLLEGCDGVDDYVRVTRGVIEEAEVRRRWDAASNKGQFRREIGNRLRGEIKRERDRLTAMRLRG